MTLGAPLGRREMQVLQLMSTGKQPTRIAKDLHVSVSTVNMYRNRIAKKSGCTNSLQIGVWAAKRGLV